MSQIKVRLGPIATIEHILDGQPVKFILPGQQANNIPAEAINIDPTATEAFVSRQLQELLQTRVIKVVDRDVVL